MTGEYEKIRAAAIAEAEVLDEQIEGLRAERDKKYIYIEALQRGYELRDSDAAMQPTKVPDISFTPAAPRRARTASRPISRATHAPKETAVAKEKQKRPPVARPVREYLKARGAAHPNEILAHLRSLGVPGDSIEKYFERARRKRELIMEDGLYLLPEQVAQTSHNDFHDAAEETQPYSKPRMSIVETLDFIDKAGSMGVNEWQLDKANALDAANELLEQGDVERFSDGDEYRIRVPERVAAPE